MLKKTNWGDDLNLSPTEKRMDIKQYISSGILENYALGLVTETERREVEQMTMEYPEIRVELDAIEAALGDFAVAEAVDLPAGLADAALAKIDALENAVPQKDTKNTTEKAPSSFSNILWGLAAIGLAMGCFYLYSQNLDYQNNLLACENTLDSLRQNCDKKNQYLQFLESEMGILKDTSNQTIYMKGVPTKDPNAIAAVHYNTRTQKTYLDIRSLPEPPSDKQYHLWALVDGQPVDMGVFDLQLEGDSAFVEVPFIENAGAFAVTLEDFGGKPTPNLAELYVIGNV